MRPAADVAPERFNNAAAEPHAVAILVVALPPVGVAEQEELALPQAQLPVYNEDGTPPTPVDGGGPVKLVPEYIPPQAPPLYNWAM